MEAAGAGAAPPDGPVVVEVLLELVGLETPGDVVFVAVVDEDDVDDGDDGEAVELVAVVVVAVFVTVVAGVVVVTVVVDVLSSFAFPELPKNVVGSLLPVIEWPLRRSGRV